MNIRTLIALLIVCSLTAACAGSQPAPTVTPSPRPTNTPAPTSTPTPVDPLPESIDIAATTEPGGAEGTPTPRAAPCDCSADRYDCSDFCCPVLAQECLDYCRYQGVGDIHHLDRDNDGTACDR